MNRRLRYEVKKICASMFAVTLIFLATSGHCSEAVFLDGTPAENPEKNLSVKGWLTFPKQEGLRPCVIMLHGGSGWVSDSYQPWVDRLQSWGYIVLQVDSFSSRGISMENNYGNIPYSKLIEMRAGDALAAQKYLTSVQRSDKNRIALFGWSQGGTVVNHLVGKPPERGKFAAAVSFYPLCNTQIKDINTPLLVVIGEKDNVTHAYLCKAMLPVGSASKELSFNVLQNAHHAFDFENADVEFAWGSRQGFRYLYNPDASATSIELVKQFLQKHLGP
jgi:dienelactone hydrolase